MRLSMFVTVLRRIQFLRRSLAVVEMIAQEAKFCKPLLSEFVKARQSRRFLNLSGVEKTCRTAKMSEHF